MKNTFSLLVTFIFTLLPTFLLAFVPDLGHLVRHQPMMLRSNPKPFTVDGSIEIEGERAPFKITWAGTKSGYTVEFKKIPATWANGSLSELTLFREGAACMLILNKAPFPCSTLRFWGDFEFNASAERIVQTVAAVGVASRSDMAFRQVNSKELEGRAPSRVKPTVKAVQGTFLSVLEYTGGGATFVDFDSTTYAPLMASISVDGMQWELSASPNFFLEKEENKNNLIISKKIEIKEGPNLIAVVRREPLKRGTVSLPKLPSSRGSGSEVPFERFTEKGRNFLKVLFLTH